MLRSFLLSTRLSFLLIIVSLFVLSACQRQSTTAADTRSADEAALKNLDAEWSRAAGGKDLDKTASYYADDALVLPPNMAAINGRQQARGMWQGMFSVPGFGGGWKASKVEVAHSGDLGYVTGTYELSETDASGKPATDKGKYLEVWKKQADGNWKCVVDMFNSDLPSVAAEPSKPTR
jgi:ketosteroid isomerase-like protein